MAQVCPKPEKNEAETLLGDAACGGAQVTSIRHPCLVIVQVLSSSY